MNGKERKISVKVGSRRRSIRVGVVVVVIGPIRPKGIFRGAPRSILAKIRWEKKASAKLNVKLTR